MNQRNSPGGRPQGTQQAQSVPVVVFNQQGVTPADLVEKHAEEFARTFAGEREGSKTQLRRFYQEYQSLCERIKTPEEYQKYAAAVKMMLSKAAYAWRGGQAQAKIPKSFFDWLTANIKAIRSHEDVAAFQRYFEAVVGYYYAHKKDSRGDRN